MALDHSTRDDSVRLPVHITPDPFNPDGPKKIGGTAVVREPVGVVAGITGYNFPFLINLAKTVPALLAGNTLVLRPSPFIPFSALLFGEIANEIGPPRGVLNIVTGGPDVGALPRLDHQPSRAIRATTTALPRTARKPDESRPGFVVAWGQVAFQPALSSTCLAIWRALAAAGKPA